MKRISTILSSMLILVATTSAQVAINTDNSSPDNSAILDVKSTTKGFLLPRMNTIQRESIGSPVEGLIIYNIDSLSLEFWNGTAWFDIRSGNAYTSPAIVQGGCATGAFWMDRNLGATQVATSSTDALSYGDLYQWGRAADGHELRSSGTTTTNATTAGPSLGNSWDGLFITEANSPYDWLTPQDATLWQGASGTNNPCPPGFRLPTETEFDCERQSWSTNNAAGAYASPLKLSMAGDRYFNSGSIIEVGLYGRHWSNTVNGTFSRFLYFGSDDADVSTSRRADGLSVRCIKD